jgi:pimeloyl-ACP methyl ester carboxylesterase
MPHVTPPLPHVDGVSHTMVDINGLNVHVASAGAGPPLVLVHGWPQHWWCWRAVVPLLADRYRLIMPDLRGHGWTDAPKAGYEKEQLVTDLLGVIDALDLDEVTLVGHDWGGWVGFLACLRQPQRFTGFLALGIVHPFQRTTPDKLLQAWRGAYQVLLSTPGLSEALLRTSPRFVESIIRLGSTVPALSPDDRRAYGTIFQQPARARATAQLYRSFLLHELPRLHQYRDQQLVVPTRLVIGEHDPIGSAALLAGWERNAPTMSVEVLPGIGHFVPEEAPLQVAQRIDTLFATGV